MKISESKKIDQEEKFERDKSKMNSEFLFDSFATNSTVNILKKFFLIFLIEWILSY